MRRLPPNLSVLRNFESKLRKLEEELASAPEGTSRQDGMARLVEHQRETVEAYRHNLRSYNAARASRERAKRARSQTSDPTGTVDG